ncbi:MAG: DUF1501 domain-containing protein [Verrucomicrobiales bacterium]|nr:DUF1501 domain-containing protein [Verrucomicrobiales bacterium]
MNQFDAKISLDRRDFLACFATGLGGVALATLLSEEQLLQAATLSDAGGLALPHHPPKAKRVIQIFLQGGLSQVDSFDYKPELAKYHGKALPENEKPDVFFGKVGLLHQSHWPFKQRGQSGLWISDLFPHLAELADELTLIRSMVSSTGNHTPGTFEANSGFRTMGFPVMGAWLSYALGSETDNLPTFVVLADVRGIPTGGANNWTSAFLPARHQGVLFHTAGALVSDLHPERPLKEETRLARYALLAEMNRRHLAKHDHSDALGARIRSYELAARMQMAVPEAADLKQESKGTRALYGLDQAECVDFGRSCLLARRLLERGVRFVQLWSGAQLGGPTWDSHGDVPGEHGREAKRIDLPIAGLLRDLRQRGMLDDTLVIFNTEFGRTPFAQSEAGTLGKGRDHNQTAFTVWLAGAGLNHGLSYGATDEWGYKVVSKPTTVHDFHATVLHLMGINHERLTFYHNGILRRLTNVEGELIKEVLA